MPRIMPVRAVATRGRPVSGGPPTTAGCQHPVGRLLDRRRSSSAWQSNRLVSGRSWVRIPSPALEPTTSAAHTPGASIRRDERASEAVLLMLASVVTLTVSGGRRERAGDRRSGRWCPSATTAAGSIGSRSCSACSALFLVVFLTIQYMRYAPRFSKDEEGLKLVRADRVRLGQELPRRNVDLSQAAPVVVAPPAVPAAAAPALAAAPPRCRAAAPAAAPAAAEAAPADRRAAPADEAPAPADPAEAPAAEAPAAAEAARARAAAPEERPEVTMDQEAYEAALKELLDAGHRSPHRRGQGPPGRHDRRSQEGDRRGLNPPRRVSDDRARRKDPRGRHQGRLVHGVGGGSARRLGDRPAARAARRRPRHLRARRASARACARTSASSCRWPSR